MHLIISEKLISSTFTNKHLPDKNLFDVNEYFTNSKFIASIKANNDLFLNYQEAKFLCQFKFKNEIYNLYQFSDNLKFINTYQNIINIDIKECLLLILNKNFKLFFKKLNEFDNLFGFDLIYYEYGDLSHFFLLIVIFFIMDCYTNNTLILLKSLTNNPIRNKIFNIMESEIHNYENFSIEKSIY